MKIGMIGLDTSHAVAFTELLNNEEHPHHIEGGLIVAAYPGGSPDFELSHSRVKGFTEKLRDQFGVRILQSPEEVAESCDAVMIESVDGRVHLEQFKRVAPYGKPVFIDKPFALTSTDARAIAELADVYGVPVMSCSSLRYATSLTIAASNEDKGAILGVDCFGPMMMEETQTGFFWYGIHTVEMLFSVLGTGCIRVQTITTEEHDTIVGVWADGRIGTIRGNRCGNYSFGAALHREKGTQFIDADTSTKPFYASLLENVIKLFTEGVPDVKVSETLRIIRFIEAANESRTTGLPVDL